MCNNVSKKRFGLMSTLYGLIRSEFLWLLEKCSTRLSEPGRFNHKILEIRTSLSIYPGLFYSFIEKGRNNVIIIKHYKNNNQIYYLLGTFNILLWHIGNLFWKTFSNMIHCQHLLIMYLSKHWYILYGVRCNSNIW